MRVRDAGEGDLDTIATFNERLAEESEGLRLDPDTIRRGVRRALGRDAACRYFLAEDGDGRVVGQTMVTYEQTDWRDGVVWWIQSVYVRPEARGAGVFDALYRHVEDTARRDPDARGLRLYVHAENARARRVYERLGMERTDYLVYEHDWSGSVTKAS